MSSDPVAQDRRRLAGSLAVVGLLYGAVFALRVGDSDPDTPIGLLYLVPVALVAIRFGLVWGLAAAALGFGLLVLGAEVWVKASYGFGEYATRAVALFVPAAACGLLADRLHAATADAERYFDISVDLLCVVDLEANFVRVNPAWEQTLGWTREELLGRPLMGLVHPGDRERTLATFADAARIGDPMTDFENRCRCKDGSYRTLLWSGRTASEEGLSYAVAKDITERRRLEEKAEAARREADRANRAKSEFLSRMSHELRTPLNSILGFSQLLQLDELPDEQHESVKQIERGGRHLLELIDEMLDISRIEAGTMRISLEPIHLGSAIAEALSLVAPLAGDAGVRLEGDPEKAGDLHVRADQQRLKQVLINLLSNAVKYNRVGGLVRLRWQVADGRAAISIEDTGPGMTREQLARLFDPFDRLGAERSGVEGTGLGLALSKSLVEAMEGSISAESEPGVGTTMRVELGVAAVEPAMLGEPVPESRDDATLSVGAKRTVVYIEDNPSNLRLVERALARLPNVRLIPAMHGELGLDLARRHRPDLVLLDLHMPDLDGEEILKRLRSDPATSRIPIVIVSADATAGRVRRLREAGASDYLTKPIDIPALLETVSAALGERAGQASRRDH